MKHMVKFKLFESLVYHFKMVADEKYDKQYVFRNKDDVEFVVFFRPQSTWRIEDENIIWVREYSIRNSRGALSSYQELNTYDTYNILKTVTEITNQFLKDYQPKKVVIEHIETRQEMQDRMKTGERFSSDTVTKRAIINSRFLKRDLIPGYSYKLIGSTSTITKI